MVDEVDGRRLAPEGCYRETKRGLSLQTRHCAVPGKEKKTRRLCPHWSVLHVCCCPGRCRLDKIRVSKDHVTEVKAPAGYTVGGHDGANTSRSCSRVIAVEAIGFFVAWEEVSVATSQSDFPS